MANLTVALGQISLKVDKSVLTRQWTKVITCLKFNFASSILDDFASPIALGP